jgi:TolB-like protein/Tfp pilus assembly protein PilF
LLSIAEIRQRKLVQWGLGYLAAAWALLQVLQFLAQSFEWPSPVLRVVTVLAAAGFVAVLILAWYHGERGQQRVTLLELLLLAAVLAVGSATAWVMRGESNEAAPLILPAEKNSIAVLPFADMSASQDQAYFSDGITEEILNALAKTRGLRVAARTSAFSFKGKDVPIDEIARRLRVTHVLEGSVRKSGDRVRITTQLIDASNGYHLWSETFDRDLQDIFAVQEEISKTIADKLQLEITGVTPTTGQQAYELYLKGRYAFARRTPDGLRGAVQYFEQAIAADPKFAPSHAGLAGALIVLPIYTDARPADLQPRAKAAANMALSLDSTLAEAWATLGYARFSYDHDWAGAETAFRRALTLNPNFVTANHWYGDYLAGTGQGKESLRYYERAAQLDPLSALLNLSLGWMYMANRRFDEAVAQMQRAIQLDSTLVDSHTHLARTRLFQGRHAEAIAGLERAVEVSGRRSLELAFLGHAYATAGRRADALGVLAELEARSKRGYVSPLTLAFVHIGLGDLDRAFAELDQARKAGDPWLTENHVDLIFDPLRHDRRWKKLLKQMGI